MKLRQLYEWGTAATTPTMTSTSGSSTFSDAPGDAADTPESESDFDPKELAKDIKDEMEQASDSDPLKK